MSGSRFTVWLAEGTTALTPPAGDAVGTPGVIDLVGVDSNTFETRARVGDLQHHVGDPHRRRHR